VIEGAAAQRQIAALALEPMLESVLAPLADAMGEFGELVAETCAEKIASRLSP
jgi:hypothetical protein